MANKPELTIIILNYNTKELLEACLKSLEDVKNEVDFEVIVSDNASTDESPEMVKTKFPWVKLLQGENSGFAAGNNRAIDYVNGELVLFLNPDTVVNKGVLKETVNYLKEHKDVGAVTCKLVLPNGELDKDVRRSYPTPWVSFSHLVLKLDKIFPKSKLFGKYWYGYIPDDQVHEVDAIQGAFFLTYTNILNKVGWFDEDYFFDGEDIDLCYRIHKKGWKLIYFPKVWITHYKGVTKGKVEKWKSKVSLKQRMKLRLAGVRSMEIFYCKNLWNRYPIVFNFFVIIGIRLYRLVRLVQVALSS